MTDATAVQDDSEDYGDNWIRNGRTLYLLEEGAGDTLLTVYLPKGVTVCAQVRRLLETAYRRGLERGEASGAHSKAHEIRKALGIDDAIEYTLRSGGYISKFDE